ncbi:MAG: DUF402 domain-containing protein [Clostridiaceae bacterium]|nr:DUF402 domain-containing protein [Clostridiaceae bacterium]
MDKIKIFRVRFIPMEEVDISKDEIMFLDEDIMVTRWDPINPRMDFAKGYSCIYLKKGYKISKIMNKDKELKFWYCDVIQTETDETGKTYRLIDLLLDVKIMPDGQVLVLDMDELAFAMENQLITQDQAIQSLRQCNSLLEQVYSHRLIEEVESIFNRLCK